MAATLSSFIPPIFRSSLQQPERFEGDFSYSYSELPVFRSRDNSEPPRRDGPGRRDGDGDPFAPHFHREERKALSLPYQNVDRCISLPRAELDIQTARANLPPKSVDKENKERRLPNFKIIPDKPADHSKCEEARKRFEFQTTCTNLPPKNVDKESACHEGQISSALRLKLKNRCEEARKKFEFRTNTKESLVRRSSCAASPAKPAEKAEYRIRAGQAINNAVIANRDSDERNFPPKVKKEENPRSERESIDFIDQIGAYLSKSDYDSPDSPPFYFSLGESSDGTFEKADRSAVASSVRRLRSSIFSSLKLPRKIAPKMAGQQQMIGSLGRDGSLARSYAMAGALSSSTNSKRKSAVEMLAESKAFYVKSETVLDRKQELPLRVTSAMNSSTGAHYATLSGRHRRGGGEPLQNQLRRLLGSTSMQSPNDSTHESRNSQGSYYTEKRVPRDCCEWEIPSHPSSATRSHYNSGTFSGNSSSGTSGSKGQVKSDPEHSRTSNPVPFSSKSLNRPSSSGDNRIFFPDSFVVPKPSRSDPANVFSNSFSIGSPFSSPEKIDARQILSVVDAYEGSDYGILEKSEYYDDTDLIEDFSTISPPAEYAITERSNYRYVRSNSHSHTMKAAPDNSYAMNINSHKSLPDLHKQAEHYTEEERRLSGASGGANYLGVVCDASIPRLDPAMRSSEALSSYSKATTSGRSNRSSVFSSKTSDGHSRRSISCHNSDPSAQTFDDTYYYNRSGSSYARDSGASSGHCSGGPPSLRAPPAPQQRRDSGSSTQHSRSHRYSSYYDGYSADGLEFRVSAPPQFQDGASTSAEPPPHLNLNATLQICANFATPRGLQGTTVTRVATGIEEGRSQTLVGIHFQASIPPLQFQDGHPPGYGSYGSEGFYPRRDSGSRESRHMTPHRPTSAYNQQMAPARYSHPAEEAGGAAEDPGASPPGLGNFRRQRCLRYKQRRPVIRSKSDISDRYYRGEGKGILPIMDKPLSTTPPSSTDNESPDRITRSQLDKFFDQFGLNDESYQQIILNSLKKPSRSKGKTDLQNNVKKSSPNHDLQAVNLNANGSPKVYLPDSEVAESSDSPVFSEISIADSNLIANNGDYTVQGMGQKDPRLYRSCEPPSIVERNARIIKWLCNCRKLQAA